MYTPFKTIYMPKKVALCPITRLSNLIQAGLKTTSLG